MIHWHLAIETSGSAGSVALFQDDAVSDWINLSDGQRTAASLAPAIEQLLAKVRQQGGTIRLISVTSGPGSFTGLRIGVTTAKTLAYALDARLVEVDALAVVARQVFDARADLDDLLVGINAYRSQVYVRRQRRSGDGGGDGGASQLWAFSHWQQQTAALPPGVAVAGNVPPATDDLPRAAGHAPSDARHLPDASGHAAPGLERGSVVPSSGTTAPRPAEEPGPRWIADPQLALPTAVATGILGAEADRRGEHVDPLRLVPRYLKPSAAEELWAARHAAPQASQGLG